MDALGHELAQSLANVKAVGMVTWDSLGQAIVVEVALGPENGHTVKCLVTLQPEAAQQLLPELRRVLEEKAPATWTRQ